MLDAKISVASIDQPDEFGVGRIGDKRDAMHPKPGEFPLKRRKRFVGLQDRGKAGRGQRKERTGTDAHGAYPQISTQPQMAVLRHSKIAAHRRPYKCKRLDLIHIRNSLSQTRRQGQRKKAVAAHFRWRQDPMPMGSARHAHAARRTSSFFASAPLRGSIPCGFHRATASGSRLPPPTLRACCRPQRPARPVMTDRQRSVASGAAVTSTAKSPLRRRAAGAGRPCARLGRR